jgi:hypothetical protein
MLKQSAPEKIVRRSENARPRKWLTEPRTVLNLTVSDSQTVDTLAGEDMAEDPVDLQCSVSL